MKLDRKYYNSGHVSLWARKTNLELKITILPTGHCPISLRPSSTSGCDSNPSSLVSTSYALLKNETKRTRKKKWGLYVFLLT